MDFVPPSDTQDPYASPEFARELTLLQPSLSAYVRTLVPNPADADEVVQAANLLVWRDRHEFRPGTDLRAWVFRTAHFEVLTHRKRRARDKLQFDEALFERLADRAADADRADRRREALAACVGRLPKPDRALLRLRYQDGRTVKELAARLGKSPAAVYRDLDRVQATLRSDLGRALQGDSGVGGWSGARATA